MLPESESSRHMLYDRFNVPADVALSDRLRLGAEGMGEVFLAEDTAEPQVVKRVRPDARPAHRHL